MNTKNTSRKNIKDILSMQEICNKKHLFCRLFTEMPPKTCWKKGKSTYSYSIDIPFGNKTIEIYPLWGLTCERNSNNLQTFKPGSKFYLLRFNWCLFCIVLHRRVSKQLQQIHFQLEKQFVNKLTPTDHYRFSKAICYECTSLSLEIHTTN